jgi:hypothetical protein
MDLLKRAMLLLEYLYLRRVDVCSSEDVIAAALHLFLDNEKKLFQP